jgi:hypothetical protein
MLEVEPNILHFCGHGGGEHGLVLQDDNGKAQFLQTEQIARLFGLFAELGLECVLLNACYSEVQAKAISNFIPYVVGMNQAIGDRAAMTFAKALYAALGAGKTVDFSFEVAKTRLIEFGSDQKVELLINSDLVVESSTEADVDLDSRERVLKLLESLLPSQFDSVIFKYNVPFSSLSAYTAQSQRSIELIRFAEQKEGEALAQLLQVIYQVAPHLEVKHD